MNIRPVDILRDRQTLLEFHCFINYTSGSPILRRAYTFNRFLEIWFKSGGPEEFLSALATSLKDPRTVVEFWESDGATAAYVWVTFTDWSEYNVTGAEIRDIMVTPEFQRRGIATQVIRHVEELAREKGASILRSGTGIENTASQGLHTGLGFHTWHLDFEKELL
jgi:GNAT superfamily N-acetyltransferase